MYAYESFLLVLIVSAGLILGLVLLNRSKKVKMPKRAKKE